MGEDRNPAKQTEKIMHSDEIDSAVPGSILCWPRKLYVQAGFISSKPDNRLEHKNTRNLHVTIIEADEWEVWCNNFQALPVRKAFLPETAFPDVSYHRKYQIPFFPTIDRQDRSNGNVHHYRKSMSRVSHVGDF